MKNTIQEIIEQQWNAMLEGGTMPLFEFELSEPGEYLVVDIRLHSKGVLFSFDGSLPVWFDGSIKKAGDSYVVPYDECFESLDYYLQAISDNITEGYLLPNKLI